MVVCYLINLDWAALLTCIVKQRWGIIQFTSCLKHVFFFFSKLLIKLHFKNAILWITFWKWTLLPSHGEFIGSFQKTILSIRKVVLPVCLFSVDIILPMRVKISRWMLSVSPHADAMQKSRVTLPSEAGVT